MKSITNQLEPTTTYISDGSNFSFQNDCPSTYFKSYESVEEIRKNAPKSFRGQYKITQDREYDSFIKSNFSNLIQDSSILNNEKFLEIYYGFYNKLNLFDPFEENRVTHNQVLFGNSCNFNNVYCPIVPKTLAFGNYYITDSLKKLIRDSIDGQKCTTSNFMPIDPIYLNLFLGVGGSKVQEDSYLEVVLTSDSNNSASIRQKIKDIFAEYFDLKKAGLGLELKVNDLTSQILGIEGISEIKTVNTSGDSVKGVQLYYTDLNHPSIIAGSVNTNIKFESIFCWLITDLNYVTDSIKFS